MEIDKKLIREALELAVIACSSPSSSEQYDRAYEACHRALAQLDRLDWIEEKLDEIWELINENRFLKASARIALLRERVGLLPEIQEAETMIARFTADQ